MNTYVSIVRQQLARLLERRDDAIDLGFAALLIAQEEYPDRDLRASLAQLDDLAARVRARLSFGATAPAIVEAINQVMFVEAGFRGNDENYYDARNSFLNDVLDRKLGIPITISLVFMEVARRVGLTVDGVGLPGHFIVAVQADEQLLIDPYHQGQRLTEADCAARVRQVSGGRVSYHASMLRPLTRRQILTRMLNNLKNIYARSGDLARMLAVVDRLILLNPNDAAEYRDRGAICRQVRFFGQALADLRRYLDLQPNAADESAVQASIATIETELRWVN